MIRWLAVLCLLGACNSGIATQPRGKSPRTRGGDKRSSAPQRVVAEEDEEDEAYPPTPARPSGLAPAEDEEEGEAQPAEQPAEAPVEAAEEEPVRDFAAELRTALGSPVACLTPREVGQGPDQLTISVSATVTATGMVTRAEASSADLSAGELVCVRQRALAARLGAPVEDAPRTVMTTITLNRQR